MLSSVFRRNVCLQLTFECRDSVLGHEDCQAANSKCVLVDIVSGFYPPKSGIKIGCNFPQFLTLVFASILGFSPL